MDGTPTLHLLKAEDLPGAGMAGRRTARVAAALDILDPVHPVRSDGELLARIEAALARLEGPGAPTAYTAEENENLQPDRYDEHDAFFGAVRVAPGSSPVEAYVRTLLEAHRGHLGDVMAAGLEFAEGRRRDIELGFAASLHLVRRFTGHPDLPPDPGARGVAAVRVEVGEVEPLLRWKLGHQVFFAMIQSLVVALNRVVAGIDGDDERGAVYALDNAAVVMCGSAAALRYAGDFSPAHYTEIVRPAMSPPHLQPKFSGLQLRDHRHLLRLTTTLRKKLAARAAHTPVHAVAAAYDRFTAAMKAAYDEHVHVCSRFGGDQEPSLRMSAEAATVAAEVLERLKHGRLHSMKWR